MLTKWCLAFKITFVIRQVLDFEFCILSLVPLQQQIAILCGVVLGMLEICEVDELPNNVLAINFLAYLFIRVATRPYCSLLLLKT